MLAGEGNAAAAVAEIGIGLRGVGQRLIGNSERCSAGCSSGLCEGWNTSLMPSGTARFPGPCHPALSSCRTIRLFSPAPGGRLFFA